MDTPIVQLVRVLLLLFWQSCSGADEGPIDAAVLFKIKKENGKIEKLERLYVSTMAS